MAEVTVTQSLKIVPINEHGQCRTGTLTGITKAQIKKKLGFAPNLQGDPWKVTAEWGFQVGSEKFGIWDYKGSAKFNEFSTYGDPKILKAIFGPNYYSER